MNNVFFQFSFLCGIGNWKLRNWKTAFSTTTLVVAAAFFSGNAYFASLPLSTLDFDMWNALFALPFEVHLAYMLLWIIPFYYSILVFGYSLVAIIIIAHIKAKALQ